MENPEPKKAKYPKAVFFIIGNEFCERFSYYGMRTVLTLYFTQVLHHSQDDATLAFHAFAMACYFTPVFGAIIADSFLGKFRTILYISILYAIGNVILSYASYAEQQAVSVIGLLLIAVGTGGIKPCVSAFGGDQFKPGQEKQLSRFFAIFYFAINAGSLVSTAVTPIFREDVSCSARGDCFPLAFGVPAALMLIAVLLFFLGKPLYTIIPAAKGNVVVQVVDCVFRALCRKIRNKLSSKGEKREHWLDYADYKYDYKLINDVKPVMRVLFLYLPLPVFWALFDQQGSRWTLQALKMNGNFFGVYRVKPDQIQVINPVLIILMIPLFETLIYPMLNKCHLLTKPLQRITVGGLLAAASFVIAAFVQIAVDKTLPNLPEPGFGQVTVINGATCPLHISGTTIESLKLHSFEVAANQDYPVNYTLKAGECHTPSDISLTDIVRVDSQQRVIVYITPEVARDRWSLNAQKYNHSLQKPEKGATVRIFYDFSSINMDSNSTIVLHNSQKKYNFNISSEVRGSTIATEIDLNKGGNQYELSFAGSVTQNIGMFTLDDGAFDILVTAAVNDTFLIFESNRVVVANEVSIFWQAFQYIVITAGEVMFSITGLEFSYSQAPSSMKSVLQAAWLLTVAFGNLLVVIIIEYLKLEKQTHEFFFFAGLMALDMIVFAVMAYFYVYVNNDANDSRIESDNQKNDGKEKQKVNYVNNGYEEDSKF